MRPNCQRKPALFSKGFQETSSASASWIRKDGTKQMSTALNLLRENRNRFGSKGSEL